jgi:hypothetical protein
MTTSTAFASGYTFLVVATFFALDSEYWSARVFWAAIWPLAFAVAIIRKILY